MKPFLLFSFTRGQLGLDLFVMLRRLRLLYAAGIGTRAGVAPICKAGTFL